MSETNMDNPARSSKTGFVIIGVVVLLALLVGFFFMMPKPSSAGTGNVAQNTQVTSQKVKLSDTKYAKDSYLISAPALSAQALNAISGFNISRVVNPDGSLNIVLVALNSGYKDQTYHILSGQSLYFIETYAGDDSAPKGEGPSLMDDKAVIVDKDGYAITPLPTK